MERKRQHSMMGRDTLLLLFFVLLAHFNSDDGPGRVSAPTRF